MPSTAWRDLRRDIVRPFGLIQGLQSDAIIADATTLVCPELANEYAADGTFNGYFCSFDGVARRVTNYAGATGTLTLAGAGLDADEEGVEFDLYELNPRFLQRAYNRARRDVFTDGVGVIRQYQIEILDDRTTILNVPSSIRDVIAVYIENPVLGVARTTETEDDDDDDEEEEETFVYGQRVPDEDFVDLTRRPNGLVGNTTRLYVTSSSAAYVNAYNRETKADVSSEEIDFYSITGSGHVSPSGVALSADGANILVAAREDSGGSDYRIYSIVLSTGLEDTAGEMNTDNGAITELWSDGTDLHVLFSDGQILAYSLSNGQRNSNKDFTSLGTDGIGTVRGLWGDDTYLWVCSAATDRKIYAYRRSDQMRVPDLDIDLDDTVEPWGIWSDGTHLWVADRSGSFSLKAYYFVSPEVDPDTGAMPDPFSPAAGHISRAANSDFDDNFRPLTDWTQVPALNGASGHGTIHFNRGFEMARHIRLVGRDILTEAEDDDSLIELDGDWLNPVIYNNPVSYTHLRAPRDRTRPRMPSSA